MKNQLIPHPLRLCEFGLAATLPNRSSSSPFPHGEGLRRSEREASIWLCLAESKISICDRARYRWPGKATYKYSF
jgi:hypothetical protein